MNSEVKHLDENIKSEETKIKSLEDSATEAKQTITKKEKEHAKALQTSKKYEDAHKKYSEQLLDLQSQYQTLCTGISSDSVGSKTLSKRLMGEFLLYIKFFKDSEFFCYYSAKITKKCTFLKKKI